ncbi:hypothetical protein [Streptomyces sp. cg35]|uniref:hypothetical protein n=1 Tax=Streptomyces sp. cg35 TaxID=3421650 RepID=UPI003D17DF8C
MTSRAAAWAAGTTLVLSAVTVMGGAPAGAMPAAVVRCDATGEVAYRPPVGPDEATVVATTTQRYETCTVTSDDSRVTKALDSSSDVPLVVSCTSLLGVREHQRLAVTWDTDETSFIDDAVITVTRQGPELLVVGAGKITDGPFAQLTYRNETTYDAADARIECLGPRGLSHLGPGRSLTTIA